MSAAVVDFQVMQVAKTSESDRRQALSESMPVARNEKSSGGVFDLTTS
jgi:hypothetical protein